MKLKVEKIELVETGIELPAYFRVEDYQTESITIRVTEESMITIEEVYDRYDISVKPFGKPDPYIAKKENLISEEEFWEVFNTAVESIRNVK